MAEGFVLNIDDKMLQKLEKADHLITDLATKSEQSQKRITAAFREMGDKGVGAFIRRLDEAARKISSLENKKLDIGISNMSKGTSNVVDDINKIATSLSKMKEATMNNSTKDLSNSISEWNEISKKIESANIQIEKLIKYNKDYEKTIESINSGKGGHVSIHAKDEYENNKKSIEELRTQISLYRERQQAIVDNNLALKKQSDFVNSLRNYENERTSLSNRRSKEELSAMRKYYSELEKSSKESAKNLEKEAKAARKAYNERAKLYKANNIAKNSTYSGSMRFSQSANTINREIQAIKYLEAARNSLSRTDSNYSRKIHELNREIERHRNNISEVTGQTNRLRSAHRNLMDTTGQLARGFALLFSVSAIRRYVNKLIEVRGEFELQKKSLESILQDKDEVDKLWNKTIQLAVKSPFRVGELVSYTKQLAAYRVETEKLYDTNKMLADVSAGLGVDMQRLILAFGQVKAANYLRGTELRQFSEAGINILGELSKYFTELEGRAISVGDVFAMVSQRMVSFADVEEIFKRITSEGGIFYKMQEIQAETLKGQISNLRDSIDIMLNDIGKADEGLLKGGVAFTRRFVENWETISDVAIPIINALILRWTVFKLSTTKGFDGIFRFFSVFLKHIKLVTIQLTKGTAAAKAFSSASKVSMLGGWTTAVIALVAALWELYNVFKANNKVAKELSKIDLEGTFNANKLNNDYKKLVNVITDVNSSYDEQQKALRTLKNEYGDILPQQMLEAKTIREIGVNYDAAKKAIYEYVDAKTKERKISFINEEYGKDVEDAMESLASKTSSQLNSFFKTNIPKKYINKVISELRNEVESNKTDIKDIGSRFGELIEKEFGVSPDIVKRNVGGILTSTFELEEFIASIKKYKDAVDEVSNNSTFGSFFYQDMNKIKESYEKTKGLIGKNIQIIKDYYSNVGNVDKSKFLKASEILSDEFDKIGLKAPNWKNIVTEPFKLDKTIVDANVALWESMINRIKSIDYGSNEGKKAASKNFIESLLGDIEDFKGNRLQREVKNTITSLSNSMNIATTGLDKLFMSQDESMKDYAKKVKGFLEQMESDIAKYNSDVKNNVNFSPYDGDKIEQMKAQIPLVKAFYEIIKVYADDANKSGTNKDLTNEFKTRINLIKELNKEYKELNKTFSEANSKQRVLDSYNKTFKDLFGSELNIADIDFTNERGLVKSFEKLVPMASRYGEKASLALEKAISEASVAIDVDIEVQKTKDFYKGIEDMFSGYELSLELEKLNIPTDLASELFDLETFNLDDIRDRLFSVNFESLGDDARKQWLDMQKKLTDAEDKAQVERLKKYTKYLIDAKSERVKIKLQELKEINEVESENKYSDAEKEDIKKAIKKNAREELDKQDWKEFQGSELYIKLFQDLEYASSSALDLMESKLLELKNNLKGLSPTELKVINEQLDKIAKARVSNNPLRGFIEGLSHFKTIIGGIQDTYDEFAKQTNLQFAMEEQVKTAENLYSVSENDYNLAVKKHGANSMEAISAKILLDINKKNLNNKVNELEKQKKITEEIAKQLKEEENIKKNFDLSKEKLVEYASQAFNQLPQMASDLENVFGSMDASTKDTIDSIAEIGGGITSMAKGIMDGNPIAVLSGLTKTLGSIFAIGDKKKERQIQREIKLVENLQYAYEKLEKSIDEAYSIDTMKAANSKAKQNLQEQIQATQRMINAEESKKKTDKKRIEEWQKDIDRMKQELEDLEKERLQALGGFGGEDAYKSAAEEFANAWYDAFKETGHGLNGLEESFDEFIDNVVKKQLLIRGSERILEPLLKMVDSAVNDAILSKEELSEINMMFNDKTKKQLDALYQSIVDNLGVKPEGGGNLSGLQKGIQGITEETAQIIEAYLNSIRFFVSDDNMKITRLVDNLTSTEIENPIVSQLKIVASQTTAIRNLLDSLTAPHPTLGGRGLKMIM